MPLRFRAHSWGRLPALALAMCVFAAPAFGQPKGKADKGGSASPSDKQGDKKADKADKIDGKESKSSKDGKVKTFDFNGLDLNGRMRTPQLLYFLERANEELERASLEKRSFIPAMAKSVEEEQL
ncbi:MAG TPA: hypothetical protein VFQ65_05795 [Kofleriaceae bacterium]|nr:hypothetical protein [Kofleriaceae bacterium]